MYAVFHSPALGDEALLSDDLGDSNVAAQVALIAAESNPTHCPGCELNPGS